MGPSLGSLKSCPSDSWSFGISSQQCPPSPEAICGGHTNCDSCLKESATKCGYCASSGKCVPHSSTQKDKCPWGWTEGQCIARCSSTTFKSEMEGFVWLGANNPGSQLFYRPRQSCKWILAPGAQQDSSTAREIDVDSMTITFLRVDLGVGDTIRVFDSSRSVTRKLYEFRSDSVDELPLTLNAESGYVVVDFSSDLNENVGTGFLAEFKGNPRPLLDVMTVAVITLMAIVACICCMCCSFRCCLPNPEDNVIENDFGG